MRRTLALIILALCPLAAGAQTLVQKADSLLDRHYHRITYDTNYILRPERRWTLKLRPKLSWFNVNSHSTIEGYDFLCDVNSTPKGKLSLSAGYSGLNLSFSANPEKILKGNEQDVEVHVDYYGKRMGFEFGMSHIGSLEGYLSVVGDSTSVRVGVERGDVSQFNITLNAYYIFNRRHFSYPAAFTQSYIQRRSAGSLMAGAYIYGGQTTIGDSTAGTEIYLVTHSMFALGLGYGYNFVLPLLDGKQWLFHISAIPYFSVGTKGQLRELGDEREWKTRFPEVIIVARGAAIRSFGNWFAGLTMQYMWLHTGNSDAVELNNAQWHFMGVLGIRL